MIIFPVPKSIRILKNSFLGPHNIAAHKDVKVL